MKKSIALALVLALGSGFVHADEKKSEKSKAAAKQNGHAGAKSDKNAAQKAESSIGKWARENKIWGKPRPGDRQ
jgi:hypothetical protein